MSTRTGDETTPTSPSSRTPAHIAAGVDGWSGGHDAAALARVIGTAVGADVMLVAVHPHPVIALPAEMGWRAMHEDAEKLLRRIRDTYVPDARIDVESDLSVPRALLRVVTREHRDLLVLGSSQHGAEDRVTIGRHSRQLLGHCPCPLAIAPRGYAERTGASLGRVGVGFDGGAEAQAALGVAASLAAAAGARLHVRAVVDDRLPTVGWTRAHREAVQEMWDRLLEEELDAVRAETETAVRAAAPDAELEIVVDAPGESLVALSEEVDLLVIGSRRWGALARVLLGTSGERLVQDARCPVLVVPRPAGAPADA